MTLSGFYCCTIWVARMYVRVFFQITAIDRQKFVSAIHILYVIMISEISWLVNNGDKKLTE